MLRSVRRLGATDCVLAGSVMLLAAVAVWPWVAPSKVSPLVPSESRAAVPADLPALPPVATLSAILERPVFSRSRRPPRSAAPAVPAGSPATRYRLVGVVVLGHVRRAMLVDGGRKMEVFEGTALDQWTVTHIGQDYLILSSPAGDTELKLRPAGDRRTVPPDTVLPQR